MPDSIARFRSLFFSMLGLVVVSSGTAFAQPFDQLHCYKMRDTVLHEAAVDLIERDGDLPETCTVKSRAVRACVPVRASERASESPAGDVDGSLLFDRLCYKLTCEPRSNADTAAISDRFGDHEFALGDTTTVCMPAALGDMDDFINRGDDANVEAARKRAAGISPGVDLFTCGDFNDDGNLTATDALGILRVAIGTGTCVPCVCDVDQSDSITATDALASLQNAVGILAQLNCIEDGRVVTWDGGGDGTSWSDPLNWSLDTRIPNICEDVVIATGAIVTVEHDAGDNEALRVTSGFPLDIDRGSLTLRDTIQINNTFRFTGGTLADATIIPPSAGGSGPVFTSSSGTLDAVTMNAPMDMTASSANIRIDNGLTLNGTASMGTSAQMLFNGGSPQSLSGTGDVLFTSNSQGFVNCTNDTDLTIGADVTIHGKAGRVCASSATATLTNNGTIHSDEAGSIQIRAGGGWTNENQILASNGGSLDLQDTWTNNAMISITGGGTLHLDGDWNNAGTISSTESLVELDGMFTLSDLGTFNRSGGTVELEGIFDNILALQLNATTGSWEMRGGTILGGAVTTADGAEMIFTSTSGTLDGVTFNAPMNMSASSANIRIDNGLTLNDTASMGTSAQMLFNGGSPQTLSGTGDVLFTSNSQGFVNCTNDTDLTIDADVTIHGKAGRVCAASATATLTNNGTIHSDEPGDIQIRAGGGWTNENQILASNGGSLDLQDTWTNNSMISITGGGTLHLDGDWNNAGTISSTDSLVELDGTFTLSDLGTFDRSGGTVELEGVFDNAPGLLLDSTTGSWEMRGGTILGGAVTTADGAEMIFTSTSGTLDAVTFNAPMNMSASSANIRIDNGLTLNGTASMGTSAQMLFNGGSPQTLSGTGDVLFTSNSQGFVNCTNDTDLTIGADVTIHGKAGRVCAANATATLTNNGTIHSDEAGSIQIRAGGGWTNENQILASNGGSLDLQDPWTNNAMISITGGGTLHLDGDWNNAGTISSTDSVVELDGTFTLSDLGTFNRTGGTVELEGIFDNILALQLNAGTGSWEMRGGTILGGAVTTADGAEMIFTSTSGTLDAVTFNAPMNMLAGSANIRIDNGLTLNGTASMGTSAQMLFNGGSPQTLSGTGDILFTSNSQGFVNCTNDTALTIDTDVTIHGKAGRVCAANATATLTNNGTIHSDEAGTIEVRAGGGWSNAGTLQASGGGTISTRDAWSNTGSIVVGETGTFNALTGLPLTGGGDVTIDIGSATDFGVIDVTGAATLAGTLNINLTGGFTPTAGQMYTIMTYDSATGGFDTINGTDIGGGLSFMVNQGATALTLTVVN